jgi:signal transduction histidine kinase/sensor domain CHASE-containing protein
MNRIKPSKKNLVVVSTALIGLLTIIYGVSWTMLDRSLKAAELQTTHRAVESVQGLLSQTNADFSRRFVDWSSWDDTYKFVADQNSDYIESNLAPEALIKMQVDLVVYFNADRALVHSVALDENTKQLLSELPPSIKGRVSSDSALLRSPDRMESQTGLLVLPEGLMLVTAQPILDTRQKEKMRGTIIFGRYLDLKKLQELLHQYQISLEPKEKRTSLDAEILTNLSRPAIAIRALDEQRISGYTYLKDIYGQSNLLLEVTTPRSIYQQGQANLRYLLVALIIVGTIFWVISLLLLNRQSRLYQKVQFLNSALETQVEERTYQLSQALNFEALLKRITDKVRDSLDETQILQTAVEELARGLLVECCDTALYDFEQNTSMIVAESVVNLPPAQEAVIAMSALPDVYNTLLEGKYVHFCNLNPLAIRPIDKQIAVLACPIFDDRGVIGDMWLYSYAGAIFSETEIRLVQQVTNQCAIALRQARLYHAAQAQVAELERLNHLKDDFLSTVSHELRTPMASIKMAIQMLEISMASESISTDPNESRVGRYFTILNDECEREIRLINDLLDISRLEAGGETMVLSTIEPEIWLMRLVDPFVERTQRQEQKFEVVIAPNLPDFTTDLCKLERIISELLQNASKYTPAGEQIQLIVTPVKDALSFQVINSGVSLAPSDLKLVFEKFYRVPKNDPWKHGGTGLGLALIKKLVHYLGGTIQATAPHNQVSFQVILPNAGIHTEVETALQVLSRSL